MSHEHTRRVGDELVVYDCQVAGSISINSTAIRAGSKNAVGGKYVMDNVAKLTAGLHEEQPSSRRRASTPTRCQRDCASHHILTAAAAL